MRTLLTLVLQPVASALELHHAVTNGNLSLVQQLLAKGADPCARDEKVSIGLMRC